MPPSPSSSRFALAALAVLAAYLAYFVITYWNSVLLDFAPIYVVGKIFLSGQWECFYDYQTVERLGGFSIYTGDCLTRFAIESGYPASRKMPMTLYLYSPSFIPLTMPLSLLPWRIIEKMVLLTNAAALAGILIIVARAVISREAAAGWLLVIAAVIITGEPARWCVFTGQATPWMFLLALGAWRLGERGGRWEIAAGVCLALAFWMKFFPGLFVLFWLREQRWRAIGAFAAGAAAWFGMGWMIFGAAVHGAWLDVLRTMGTGVAVFPVNQSFESMLMRARLPIWDAVLEHNFFLLRDVKLFAMLCKGFLLAAYLSVMIRPAADARRRALQAALTLAVCPILLSVSWNHYSIFCLPLTAWLLAEAWKRRESRGAAWAAMAALLAVLAVQYSHFRVIEQASNLLIKILGRDGATPLGKLLFSRHLIGTLLFITAGVAWHWRLKLVEIKMAD